MICNTFIEGQKKFLQNIFLCCWNDLGLFHRHNSFCTVFWVSSFYLSVNIVELYQFMASKTSHLKLKREVSNRLSDGRFKIAIVFGSSTTFQRREEWICERRCLQVSVRLHVLQVKLDFRLNFFNPD